MTRPKPVLLCILDGWGHEAPGEFNAIAQAKTPHWDRLIQDYPHSLLATSGLAVGLPEGQMGNSEVGHMTIGAGRIIMQDLPRIDAAIADGSLAKHPSLQATIADLKANGKALHLMGLFSDGGVHAHIRHIIAIAKMVAEQDVPVKVHAFIDGRDTPPQSAPSYLEQFKQACDDVPNIQLATLGGRYYGMDRDKRYERVAKAYDAMVSAKAERYKTAEEAIEASYALGKNDEFIEPVVLGDYQGMADGDAFLMANFRADRARQILDALVNKDFDGFARSQQIAFSHALGMVEYSEGLSAQLETIFPSQTLDDIFGEVIAREGLTQLRIAETEKYAHVTFFFNGGKEAPLEGEERILVPSPKVATYDLQPEMACPEVTEKLVEAIASDAFDVIVVNYANTDMVGHTGDMDAAVKAVEAVDVALGKLTEAIEQQGGVMFITADHGNAEQMRDGDGVPHTQHTTGPVPFVGVGLVENAQLQEGTLADIAPTLLDVLGIAKPKAMKGISLLASS